MKIRVLGSAAGGGFPQWNCNCRNCAGVRTGALRARPRTQSSIAIRADGVRDRPDGAPDSAPWVLINASPDVLTQLGAHADFQPARCARDTALCAIVLVDGQVDHTTGLYMLREAVRPWPLWCTDTVFADLTRENPVIRLLGHYCGVEHNRLPLDGTGFFVAGAPGIRWHALPVPGKPAPYSPKRECPAVGDNVALLARDVRTGGTLFYAPGLADVDEPTWRAMLSASCVLVDGTFWSDDEMIALGLSRKRARDIGHLALSGGGMLERLADLPAATRKVLIHVNNTNPILDEDSPERAELDRRGVEVAWDGLEIDL